MDIAVAHAVVAEVEVETRTLGAGGDLLFLHPGTGIRDHQPILEALSRSFRVSAPSHPGFDGSSLPASYDTIDDLAYFYLDFVAAQRLRNVVLVGSSLGGWIAAEMAIKCAAHLSALVLIGPVGVKFGAPSEREIFDLFSWPIYQQDRHLFKNPALRDRTYAELAKPDAIAMARNHESFARIGWSPTLYDPKLRQRLPRITLPTLVLRGDSDGVTPDAYARAFAAAIPGAEFGTIADAGHYPQVEQADAVAEQITAFVHAHTEPGS